MSFAVRLPAPARTLLVALGLLAAASPALADDVIVLKNGREIRGRIVEEREDAVKIDIGGGKMTYRREQIASVQREGASAPAAPTAPTGGAATPVPDTIGARREEHFLLYADGARVGTRVFRASRLADVWMFEEEIVHLDAKGLPVREVRLVERADLGLRPISFQLREAESGSDGSVRHRTLSGEMRGGRLYLVRARDGIREKSDAAAPEGGRFPFALREEFLRAGAGDAPAVTAKSFDARVGAWEDVTYEDAGRRTVRLEGRSLDVRVILRRRGARTEHEWVQPDLAAAMGELDGEIVRALATSGGAVARLRAGDAERATGADSAARTRYVDPERGWRIGKPDPSWTFELPAVRGTGALLVVRNEAQFASVDVLFDPTARDGTTPEGAVEALLRTCRAASPDFTVVRSGWTEKNGARTGWFEAKATTKGEPTRTLARVLVRGGRVWRLLAACPDGAFDVLRPDLEKILDSFTAE